MAHDKLPGNDRVERLEPLSRSQKNAAWLIRAAGFLLGIGLAALYLFVIWSARADLDHVSRPIALVIFIPLALFIGPFWAADWFASRIDKRRLTT